jgi:hypothetical protein
MPRETGDRMLHLAGNTPERREEVAELLDRLAQGDVVRLGEFGDGGSAAATPADEQAAILYEVAATLRRQA